MCNSSRITYRLLCLLMAGCTLPAVGCAAEGPAVPATAPQPAATTQALITVQPAAGVAPQVNSPNDDEAPAGDDKPDAAATDRRRKLLDQFVKDCVTITPGKNSFPVSFDFGCTTGDPLTVPARKVTVKHSFRISKYEMTQDLYELVMKHNPSRWKGPRNSAESMTFADAEQFCRQITGILHAEKLIAPMDKVRLPTEIEWEYACRAGSSTRYCFGDTATEPDDEDPKASVLNAYAWHTGNAAGNDPEVGVLKPNAWQLYDTHGYLWEFASDPFTEDAMPPGDDAKLDPKSRCTVRGGSWRDHYTLQTSATRYPISRETSNDAIGFRCVITLAAE